MNMSEAVWPGALGEPKGFRRDSRFSPAAEPLHMPPPEPEAPADDPVARAYAEGFAAGCAMAEAQAEERARADAEAREGLSLSFARLDRELEEELRLRLRDTVAALCETAIAPLTLDEAMLMQRIEKAVSMLARADDVRIIRLNPDDLKLISPRLAADWQVAADATLERGSLRVESANGGVEDGPQVWRRAIAEALGQC